MAESMIACGAEAMIVRKGGRVVKQRVCKGYRHPDLDAAIRRQRTRREAKLLLKAASLVSVPRVFSHSEQDFEIVMQFVSGKKLSDSLERMRTKTSVCRQIGTYLGVLHDAGIIHGDLTTSNMVVSRGKLYFLDFGLGFHSDRIEDKAVDLHLIHEALTSKHAVIAEACFAAVLRGYRSSANADRVLARLQKVMQRGRYKSQY